MVYDLKGVVFKTIKYSESSVICKIYTDQFGIESYIINGFRSGKSRSKQALVQPLSLVDLEAYHRENKNLQRLKNISFNHVFHSLPFDIIKSTVGIFILEMLNITIKEGEVFPEMFNYIFKGIQKLDGISDSAINFHVVFLARFTQYLGFMPSEQRQEQSYFDLREGVYLEAPPLHGDFMDEESSLLFDMAMRTPLDKAHELPIDRKQRIQMIDYLILFYRLHLTDMRKLNSYEILREVLR